MNLTKFSVLFFLSILFAPYHLKSAASASAAAAAGNNETVNSLRKAHEISTSIKKATAFLNDPDNDINAPCLAGETLPIRTLLSLDSTMNYNGSDHSIQRGVEIFRLALNHPQLRYTTLIKVENFINEGSFPPKTYMSDYPKTVRYGLYRELVLSYLKTAKIKKLLELTP